MCCKLPEYSRILLGRVELVVVVVVGSDRLSGNLYQERERERERERELLRKEIVRLERTVRLGQW